MKSHVIFEANDGTRFDTEAEAIAHDAKLEAEATVASYLSTTPLKGAQATMARNAILGYIAYTSGPAPVTERPPIDINEAYPGGLGEVHAASAPHDATEGSGDDAGSSEEVETTSRSERRGRRNRAEAEAA